MKKLLLILTLIILNANLGEAENIIPDCECNKIQNNINIEKKAELTTTPDTSINYKKNNSKEIKKQNTQTQTKKSWWRFW